MNPMMAIQRMTEVGMPLISFKGGDDFFQKKDDSVVLPGLGIEYSGHDIEWINGCFCVQGELRDNYGFTVSTASQSRQSAKRYETPRF